MFDLLETAITSPWVYLALFAIATLDGFFPVVPSETMVITAGVFAASGEPNLALVILVAAAGAFCGDHISYQIGRSAGQSLVKRLPDRGRRRATFDWAANALQSRGGLLLVVARYIPGGRTAATLTTGAVRYPRRKFALFDAAAAISWGAYSALVGYIGGEAFEDDKLKGLMLGLGLAIGTAIIVELVRFLRHARRRASRRRELDSASRGRELGRGQVGVVAVAADQLSVRTHGPDPAAFQDHDAIGGDHRGQSVRDDEHRGVSRHVGDGVP
jgi:membrane-associated protein